MMPFRTSWPRWDECPPDDRDRQREAAVLHWSSRVEKHSKSNGCIGCLSEAQNELSKWREAFRSSNDLR